MKTNNAKEAVLQFLFNNILPIIEVGFISIFAPFFFSFFVVPNTKDGSIIFWISLVCLFAVVVLYKVIKKKIREEYAEYIRSEIDVYKERYKQAESSLAGVTRALNVFSESFHLPVNASHNASICGGEIGIEIKMNITPAQICDNLKSITRYVSSLYLGLHDRNVRCGILAFRPGDRETLWPLVTFVPGDENYISINQYPLRNSFSGDILRRYEGKINTPDWKNYLSLVYPDIQSKSNLSQMMMLDGQEDYIKSIAGSILYYPNPMAPSQRIIVGFINIDSKEPNAILENDYTRMIPYMIPVISMLAVELNMIYHSTETFDVVWKNRDRGRE